ncbi:MAG: TetR/AcrR family transcriptional regulator [Clostridiales bacterium]|nr:TetR/AcrR family transcriptional regulator [Clostridiales bacterium]
MASANKKSLENQLIKKQRVMRYFIDAAREIANENGLSGVTIRSVADRAGYNSASLYNYFNNLDQLMAFTSIDLVSNWLHELIEILEGDGDELDKYIMGWKTFSLHSFQDPPGFAYIYASENTDMAITYFEEYFEIFPEPCDNIPEDILNLYKKKTLLEQEKLMIAPCVKAGFFDEKDAEGIYSLALLLHNGLLWTLTKTNIEKSPQELSDVFMKYFVEYIQTKLKKTKDLTKYIP